MRFAVAALVLTSAFVTASARADGVSETDRQIAQSLFEEARVLLLAGKATEACPKLAESQRLDPGGGTVLNLAVCLELSGRMASAQSQFREGLAIAVREGRKEREELARTHLADIAPKIMRVAVIVPPAIAEKNPTLMLDGSRVPRAAWETAIAVDPGTHRIAVTGAGLTPWETSFEADVPGQTFRIEVGNTVTADAAGEAPAPAGKRSAAFWVVGSVGVAGVVAGSAFGIMALVADSDAKAGCFPERSYCTSDAHEAASRARTMAWVSTVAMGAGVVAIATAFLLPRRSVAVQVAPSAGGGIFVGLRATSDAFR